MPRRSRFRITMTGVLTVLVSLSLIAMVATIFYHFVDTRYQTVSAVIATANESKIFDGVYIRDESVLSYNGSGAINYLIADGGKAAVGNVIAQVYQSETEIETRQQIASLQASLDTLQRISNVGTLNQAQPEALSRQITDDYKTMVYEKDDGDLTALAEAKESFLESLSTYQVITSGGAVSFASQIADLESQIEILNTTLGDPIGTITADAACYFVSSTDGYESSLTKENLDDLTPQSLEQIIAQTSSGETQTNENVIGKTIAAYDWYMVGMIDNTDLKYEVGDSVTLRILNSGAEAEATIQDLKRFEGVENVMVVLMCEKMTSDFVGSRTDQVEMILGEYEGIKVPRDAIRFLDGVRGVYIENGEATEFRQLDVIYEGSDYVLSSLQTEDGFLKLYDSIITEGIDANGS